MSEYGFRGQPPRVRSWAPPATEDADSHTSEEERFISEQREAARIRNEGDRQDIRHRRRFAIADFVLVVVWLIGVWVLVFIDGFQWRHFSLPASVLNTLIGSTTASILGLFGFVMRYLFPRRDGH